MNEPRAAVALPLVAATPAGLLPTAVVVLAMLAACVGQARNLRD